MDEWGRNSYSARGKVAFTLDELAKLLGLAVSKLGRMKVDEERFNWLMKEQQRRSR